MTERQENGFDWGLLFLWLVATTMGWFLSKALLPSLWMVSTGLGIGLLQWFVLQSRIRTSWTWALASIAGWTIGALFTFVAVPAEYEFFAGPIIGLTMGIAQWLVLRRAVYWAGWWIIVSVLAWTTGLSLLPGILLTGMMIGLLTGIVLALLLQFPKPVRSQTAE